MDRSRVLGVLALVALLALAGCQVPGSMGTGAAAPNVTVVNATGAPQGSTIPVAGNGTVDPGVVFMQVQTLLASDVEPPNNVRVLEDTSSLPTNTSSFQSPVRRHLNVTARGELDLGDQEQGFVNNFGGITIYPGQARDPAATTWVLAHELTHYVQVRSGRFAGLQERIGLGTTDGQFVYRAMLEGPAVYTTEAYLDEYASTNETTLTLYRTIAEGLPPGSAGVYVNRQYLLGYQYTRTQVDSPAELEGLYDTPALTSEHLIHGYDPATEPMAALNVTYESGDAWSVTGRDRMGEAFVWTALEDRLGSQEASAAAAGWGNDSLLTVYPTDVGNASFAWVLRWDDATNASEFADDARDYLDQAGTARGDLTRLDSGAFATLQTAGDRTTVLLIGERAFVAGTSVDDAGANVTLSTGDG